MNAHLPYKIDEKTNKFHFYENLWKKEALKLLFSHSTNASSYSLFDVGCGRGEMLMIARELGMKPYGCDLDPNCVEASGKYGKTWRLEKGKYLSGIASQSFDVVSCLHVLEHCKCPINFLNDLTRISKRYVILAVPNLRNLSYFRKKPRSDNLNVNKFHLQGWDHETLLNLAINHASLRHVDWTFDATILPGLSSLIETCLGTKICIKMETSFFKKLFPYHGHSCIGLFEKNVEHDSRSY